MSTKLVFRSSGVPTAALVWVVQRGFQRQFLSPRRAESRLLSAGAPKVAGRVLRRGRLRDRGAPQLVGVPSRVSSADGAAPARYPGPAGPRRPNHFLHEGAVPRSGSTTCAPAASCPRRGSEQPSPRLRRVDDLGSHSQRLRPRRYARRGRPRSSGRPVLSLPNRVGGRRATRVTG